MYVKSFFFQFCKCAKLFAQDDPLVWSNSGHILRGPSLNYHPPSAHPVLSFPANVGNVCCVYLWSDLIHVSCRGAASPTKAGARSGLSIPFPVSWHMPGLQEAVSQCPLRDVVNDDLPLHLHPLNFLICKVINLDKVFPKTLFSNQKRTVLRQQRRKANRREVHRFTTREKEHTTGWVWSSLLKKKGKRKKEHLYSLLTQEL